MDRLRSKHRHRIESANSITAKLLGAAHRHFSREQQARTRRDSRGHFRHTGAEGQRRCKLAFAQFSEPQENSLGILQSIERQQDGKLFSAKARKERKVWSDFIEQARHRLQRLVTRDMAMSNVVFGKLIEVHQAKRQRLVRHASAKNFLI